MVLKGFFNEDEVRSDERPDGKVLSCPACGLYQNVLSPRMESTGKGELRILILGEAPGCVASNSLIEVAYRDKSKFPNGIPIKDLVGKSNFYVYSFDIKNQKLVLGKVRRVWKTGRKKVYRVVYEWYHNAQIKQGFLDVTANHQFLLKKPKAHDPFKGIQKKEGYLAIEDGLQVGHSIQPFHRFINVYPKVGGFANTTYREGRWLLEQKIGRKLKKNEQCHHVDGNKLNDCWGNLELQTIDEHARQHMCTRENPMSDPIHRKKHQEVMQSHTYRTNMSMKLKEYLSDPKARKKRLEQIHKTNKQRSETVKNRFKNDPMYYYNYLLGRQRYLNWNDSKVKTHFLNRFPQSEFPPVDNHKIVCITYLGIQDVYDMEVETYHNFAVAGIFVHNSTEDRKGQQWQGKTGRLLQRTCKQMGIGLFDDCANINSINCRPTDSKGANRKPTTHEINCCRQRVMKVIHEIRPKVIVPLGGSAITSLLGHRWKKRLDGISKWRGWTIPDRDLGAWVCPTFHPSFVERSEKFPEVELIWKQDLKRAFDMVDVPFPKWKDEKEYVHIVTPQEARREVRELLADDKEHWVCLDYETTGLKPHLPIHRIVCASLALSTTHSIVWMTPSVAQTQTILKPILTNPNVHVCAHNMKFEQMWTKEKLEFEITRLRWDSMLAAHVIDNRNGVTGLKFQTYVNFGVVDYDSAISSYLEGVTKSANSLNKVDQLIERFGPEMLMTYCGLDTIYGLKLALKQRKELRLARGEK